MLYYINDYILTNIIKNLLIFYSLYPQVIQDYINKLMGVHFYIYCIFDTINNIINLF